MVAGLAPALSDQTFTNPDHPTAPPVRPRQQVTLVDVATGQATPAIRLGPADIYPVLAWSPDGRRLAIATDAGTLTILDAHTMRPVARDIRIAAGGADTLSYSPDGRMLVIASWDGDMRFVDAATGRKIGPSIQVADGRAYAWFDRDGDVHGYALNGDNDRQRAFTYPGRPSEWLATACATASGDLTADEWATYVTDRPYSRTCE